MEVEFYGIELSLVNWISLLHGHINLLLYVKGIMVSLLHYRKYEVAHVSSA